jgi:hypothetical protein
MREIKDSAVLSPTDEGLTDDDIDPIKCTNCDPNTSMLWARLRPAVAMSPELPGGGFDSVHDTAGKFG